MTRIAAEEYLDALAAHGIDHLFVNPGTDFAPIIEAYARSARTNRPVPKPMIVPHENAAVGMAHGYTMVTGRAQAVMLHTNVGTANAINMLIDASRDRIPMLLTSGRTPFTESGAEGSRNAHIHWAQEMYDQAGMLREMVKWDYEMKRGDQAGTVVDRALEMANTSPQGPVYLSLPREVLGETIGTAESNRAHRARPRAPEAASRDIDQLADWITAARNPLIITGTLGRDPRESTALARLAERYALPVVPFNTRYFALSANHPMFQGSAPGVLLKEADLVIVFESDVPWIPSKESPHPDAKIVQIGEDPLHARLPMRGFPSDLTLTATSLSVLDALDTALANRSTPHVTERLARLTQRSDGLRKTWREEAERAGNANTITLPWLNHCLREIVDADSIVISEYSFRQEYCPLDTPGSLFALSSAGGLGWGFPASLGAKLASPGKLVLSVLGDGAYMFANPIACHYVAQMQNLPVLTVIYNNALYGAVRRATLDMYGAGVAAEGDGRLLADLPAPAFEKIVAAHDGHGEKVERPADLPAALRRAAEAVRGGQQALVNVRMSVIRTPVLIVGGGPVGSTLALDLASRGIDVTVSERNPAGQMPGVKCNHVAARTMEVFRRLGIAQTVRNTGLPADHANDIAFRTTATGTEFARIMIPCRRDRYTDKDGPDGRWPTPEPPHRINQIYLDPLLAALARDNPRVRYINQLELQGFTQSDDGVVAEAIEHTTGARQIIHCEFLVGCDGPSSTVRHLIDARMTGDAMIGRTQSTYVRAPGLAARMRATRAWSTQVMNPRRSANMFAVDGRETWLIHNYLRPDETDFDAIDADWCIRTVMGVDADFSYDVITRENWIGRRLLADRFRDRRAFICGDAAHLWVPSAGFGMNAGIADAMNLSWMLAGVLHGWADPNILAAHEAERWPITEQVSHYAMNTSLAVARTRAQVPADIEDSAETQAAFGQAMREAHTPQFCCGGLNFGYFYDRSPIIEYDGEEAPPYTMDQFTPSTVPGCRTPHIWVGDGRSLYDAMGADFCLLRFDRSIDTDGLVEAAAFRGVPLRVVDADPVAAYGQKLVLSRPDQHVAWRGDALPDNPLTLIDRIRGAA